MQFKKIQWHLTWTIVFWGCPTERNLGWVVVTVGEAVANVVMTAVVAVVNIADEETLPASLFGCNVWIVWTTCVLPPLPSSLPL